MKTLKDVKPGDKVFILNSNRGYFKEPQIETLTVDIKAFATLEEAETGFDILGIDTEEVLK